MGDGTAQGIGPERAIKTILGGEPAPDDSETKTPAWWLERLLAKDDNIDGYDAHAEVMAKYIVLALRRMPGLAHAPNSAVYLAGEDGKLDWANMVVLVPDLSDALKKVYHDKDHPFRQALSEATGFTWGWAFNIARYALGLPPQPNPALLTMPSAGEEP